jgi:2-polyprenyl-3-methyl-5-hydroxy-6-metoxy-1,4-benzoquinol methylase/uncharacterized protein YbaR (Trm112 family)
MLLSFCNDLLCPICKSADSRLDVEPFDGPDPDHHVKNGLLVCNGCTAVYIIQDDVAYLLAPEMMYDAVLKDFVREFEPRIANLGLLERLRGMSPAKAATCAEAQLKQREHFDHFAVAEDLTYTDYAKRPFWSAVDAATFPRFQNKMTSGARILDIGCGNGRASFQILRPGDMLLGFDISRNLIVEAAQRAAKEGVRKQMSFMVCDGSAPPFRSASFDYAVTYGVLHHLPAPQNVCAHIQRILREGGIHFGCENNRSVFRKIFDFMMKVFPIWNEEAGESPLMSLHEVGRWVSASNGKLTDAYTTVFLPPHVLNLAGQSLARLLLAASDSLGRAVPPLRFQGGLIMFSASKAARIPLA